MQFEELLYTLAYATWIQRILANLMAEGIICLIGKKYQVLRNVCNSLFWGDLKAKTAMERDGEN